MPTTSHIRTHFTLLIAALLLLNGNSPPQRTHAANPNEGYVADEAAPTRLIVDHSDTAQLAQLRALGATERVDYGSFSLWQVSASQAKTVLLSGASDFEQIALRGGNVINIRSRSLQNVRGRPVLTVPARLQQTRQNAAQLWLVQFIGPIKSEWLNDLRQMGLELVSYLPTNAYVVWGSGKVLTELEALERKRSYVQFSGPYHPAYRLAPDLHAPALASISTPMRVTVQLHHTADLTSTQATLLGMGAVLLKPAMQVRNFVNLTLQMPSHQVAAVAALPEVYNIEAWVAPKKRDERQGQILAGNIANVGGKIVPVNTQHYVDWLQAQGVPTDSAAYPLVDVVDDGIDDGDASPLHPDFYVQGNSALASRLVSNSNCTTDATADGGGGHGHLNAAIIAGYGRSAPSTDAEGYYYDDGIVPFGRVAGTKIFANAGSYSISGCGNTDEGVVLRSYNKGAAITSNSWGASNGGGYDSSSQAYDALTRDANNNAADGNQAMLHVFAAGNDGPGSNTIGSPGTAKNVLTVGATENVRDQGIADGCGTSAADNADDIASFSSRGPTDDNRVKPDIMAPGTHIIAAAPPIANFSGNGVCGAASNDGAVPGSDAMYPTGGQTLYTWSSGTSHSTPAVAGTAVLAYEVYSRSIRPGIAPSPAMLKALLLNTPRYLNGSGTGGTLPNNQQGWGDVWLAGLYTNTVRQVFDQNHRFVDTGQTFVTTGTIASLNRPFNITLAWTDAPGATVGNAYVNDLDLTVTVGGQSYKGNVFSGATSIIGGSYDPRNNIESVFIPAGVSGTYTVTVTARNIVGDGVPSINSDITDQDFALLVLNGTGASGVLANKPNLQVAGTQVLEWGLSNRNGSLEPGEDVRLGVTVSNTGAITASNLIGTLTSLTPLARVATANSAYADIGLDGAQSNIVSYTVQLAKEWVCGAALPLSLTLNATDYSTDVLMSMNTGVLGAQQSYTVTPNLAIPDDNPTGITGTLVVSETGILADVDVRIDTLTHTWDGDLIIRLVSPAGTVITLSQAMGSSGDNFTNTLFDDDASVAISSGSSPFSGSYRPVSPLAALNGSNMAGTWRLWVSDVASIDTGTLGQWGLRLRGSQCKPVYGAFVPNTRRSVVSGW